MIESPYKENCPICKGPATSSCRCSGPHTLEQVNKGHGLRCDKGHRWSGNVIWEGAQGRWEPDIDGAIARLDDLCGQGGSRLFYACARSEWKPDVDVEKRILRNAVFGTTGLASDGMIILPSGTEYSTYMTNPIVTRQHITTAAGAVPRDSQPITIGRTLKMHSDDVELRGDEVQFADSDLGRQYAYLYGVNRAREAYMRMWSIEADRIDSSVATFEQARKIAGPYWNASVAARIQNTNQRAVPVWTKSALKAVAAADVGADRSALTRAEKAGIALAGEIAARMDLREATTSLEDLRKQISSDGARIARLERQIQALGRDGASAAARGDSEALLEEIRTITRQVKGQ